MVFDATTAELYVMEGYHVTSSEDVCAGFQFGIDNNAGTLLINLQACFSCKVDARFDTNSNDDVVDRECFVIIQSQDDLVVLTSGDRLDLAVGLDINAN